MLGCRIVRSTMKAISTSMLPPTVNIIHNPKQIAINTVCHNSNGGSTGVRTSAVEVVRLSYSSDVLATVSTRVELVGAISPFPRGSPFQALYLLTEEKIRKD